MAITVAEYEAKLLFDASEYKKGMSDASTDFDNLSSKLSGLAGGVVKGLGIAIAAAATAIVGFGASSLNAGMEFDSAVS